MIILTFLLFLFMFSCEKEAEQVDNLIGEPTSELDSISDIDTSNEKVNEKNKQELTHIGNGSGTIDISNVENKKYVISPGVYHNININHVRNISVLGAGNVKITNGSLNVINSNGLTISGISFEKSHQSVINIKEDANDLTLKELTFKDISNTVITFKKNMQYDGNPASYSENIHLTDIFSENIGTLFGSEGQIKNNGIYGLIKGFKLTNSTIINSPYLTNAIYLGCGENYEISNNVVDNVNKSDNYPKGDNNHNGIFHVNGNGKIFGNQITNYQGNAVRSWLFSITTPNSQVEIYDNIVYNSTRYSAFEVQVPPWMEGLSFFKSADAKIYNNTVGKLNTGEPKFYEGRIVDIYNTHGTVELFNNLYFEMRDNVASFDQSNRKETNVIERNNVYFKNSDDAVFDLIDFKSKINGVGIN